MLLPRLALVGLLLLSACSTGGIDRLWQEDEPAPPATENILDKVEAEPTLPYQPAPRPPIVAPKPQPVAVSRRAALLLPLSGAQAGLGNAMLQAAQLAVQDLAPPNFTIAPFDTNAGAAGALSAALAEQTDIIIGPLFSADVAATRAMAFARGVPMVALSNDQTQADDNTFLMGAWPGDQIQRVLAYAAENGTTRVLALLPDNAYGKSLIDVLQAGSAAPVIGIITYPAALTDPSMVLSEVKAREGQFDAILLPDGGTRAPLIATALRDAGVLANVRLLGSSLWDDVANPAALSGGWYATTDKAAQQSFAARYRQAFGDTPPALASLAYDATALAAVIAAQGWGYDASSLMHSQGFSGMAGLFRLKAGGQVQRALAIVEMAPEGQKIVDPAPSRF